MGPHAKRGARVQAAMETDDYAHEVGNAGDTLRETKTESRGTGAKIIGDCLPSRFDGNLRQHRVGTEEHRCRCPRCLPSFEIRDILDIYNAGACSVLGLAWMLCYAGHRKVCGEIGREWGVRSHGAVSSSRIRYYPSTRRSSVAFRS